MQAPEDINAIAKTDVRMAGLKNLAMSSVWFLAAGLLLVSGLAMRIESILMWPSHALRDAVWPGWKALGNLLGFVGGIFWLSLMLGWIISLPNSLFMILSGRHSESLDNFFPAPFKATSSKPNPSEGHDGDK